MPMTAANTLPVQSQQVQGAPKASAAMLLKKKKKFGEPGPAAAPAGPAMPSMPASAAMLMKGRSK